MRLGAQPLLLLVGKVLLDAPSRPRHLRRVCVMRVCGEGGGVRASLVRGGGGVPTHLEQQVAQQLDTSPRHPPHTPTPHTRKQTPPTHPLALNSRSPSSSTEDWRMRHEALATPASTAGISSGSAVPAYNSTQVRPADSAAGGKGVWDGEGRRG